MRQMKRILFLSVMALLALSCARWSKPAVRNVMEPLPGGAVKLTDYFENDIQNCIEHWNMGVMPYEKVIEFFRTGRAQFALGEMAGKALRSDAKMYRYTQDPALRELTKKYVYELIGTMKPNGSIACTPVEEQPGDKDGDIWERKYVMLALSEYYLDVEADPFVLEALEKEAHSIMDQVGPAPKKEITSLGWSANHIESSCILEPIMRLYNITGKKEYLDYATYIVEAGGCSGVNMFDQVREGTWLSKVAEPYPKAYEMLSVWEGLVEYYRVVGGEEWYKCIVNMFALVTGFELTVIGNAGADVCHPNLYGEGWSNTRIEQTNPDVKRMMETCVGVTWIKYLSQYLRLTGDALAVDYFEKYVYNGLLGAMRPDGTGFSYVNLLNGSKVTNHGWGWTFDGLPVTCCNLNGAMGLAYIPYFAVMQRAEGPVVNLYNACTATAKAASGREVKLTVEGKFPQENTVTITVDPARTESFALFLHIPAWSEDTKVDVNGTPVSAPSAGGKRTYGGGLDKAVDTILPGHYLTLDRKWQKGDRVTIVFDMRAHLLDAPEGGRNPAGLNFQAVQWGPIVLARDENIDPQYNAPVQVLADAAGEVAVEQVTPQRPGTRLEFLVPTEDGTIHMVDYASVDCWNGSHIQTWLPKKQDAPDARP